MTLVLLANVSATLFMTGLIWFVQIVHYPLFAAVGADAFRAYARSHQAWTTLVVGPPMLVEAATAVLLVAMRPPEIPAALAWTGVALVGVIWLSTALLQVPAHAKLAGGFDSATAAALVSTNWIRTIAWTARAAVALMMLSHALRALSR